MRRTSNSSLALTLAGALALVAGAPGAARADMQDPQEQYAQQDYPHFSADQLDNLVAPVALYADPLLAQVLLAATFPDQVSEAAQYVRGSGTEGIDEQGWDVSVKAVAHYPTVLNMMDTRMEWTTTLGQAYAAQSTDVMRAVQRMRRMAQAQGNLTSSPEQEVYVSDDYIRIWPAQARVIYVPVYDPAVVYIRPVFRRPGFHAFFSFGVPFPIGSWLIYDWDWPRWRIYYTGWYGGGWIARSRPYIHYTTVYINPRHRHVWYDREVLRRRPDYGRVHYYDAIHPGTRFDGGTRYATPRKAASELGPATGGATPRQALPRDNAGAGVRTGQPNYGTPRTIPSETRPAGQTPRVVPDRGVTTDRRTDQGQAPATVDRTWRRAPVESSPGREPLPRVIPMDRSPAVERPAPSERVDTRPSGGAWESVPRVERAPEPRVVPMDRGDRGDRVERNPEPRVERNPEPRVVPMDRGSSDRGRVEPQSRPAPEARPRGGDSGSRGGDSGSRGGDSRSGSSSGGTTTRRGH